MRTTLLILSISASAGFVPKIPSPAKSPLRAEATESEAPVRRKTELSLNFPGYAPYGYGYPPHPYQYAPPQPYAQPPQQVQMPPPPPYPYYYAPPPPPHGYWAPPHAPMTVPQGAYYPGATASSASSVSSSASQTE